jgi:hypothetical protein
MTLLPLILAASVLLAALALATPLMLCRMSGRVERDVEAWAEARSL